MPSGPLSARVAKNIRAIARKRRKPLTVLADFADVSRPHLFAFLAGKKDVTLSWLEKVAGALEVDPHELVLPIGSTTEDPTRRNG